MAEMDPDTEILLDCSPMFRQYRSGRVERLLGTDVVPAGLDPATGVTTKDVTIDSVSNISARLYLPTLSDSSQKKLPILIYIHGGGFCIGSAYNPNPFLNSVVARAHLLAVSVDYRLAPEHPLPAAYEDCWAALKWVVSHGSRSGPEPWLTEHADLSRVFLIGESAGANIAHNMAMRAGTEKLDFEAKIEGMVLGHPYFWGTEPIGSETTDPAIRGRLEVWWKVVNKAGVGVDDPWFNPMASGAPSLAGLGCGRALVCVAEKDMLAERGRAYYEALKGSGWEGEAELVESEEEDHVFFYLKPECIKALELLERMVTFFKRTTGFQNGQPTRTASRLDSSRTQYESWNKDTQITMKLSKPKNQPIRPIVFMGCDVHSRKYNGEIINKLSNGLSNKNKLSNSQSLTKVANSNLHVKISNLFTI